MAAGSDASAAAAAAAGPRGGGGGKQPPGQTAQPKRTRTRTGCLNCRRKKRKCDEGRPSCGSCVRRGQPCEWGLKVTFRAENAQHLDESHPSMRRSARRFPREFEILDITAEIIRDYDTTSPMWALYSTRCEGNDRTAVTTQSDSSYTHGTPVMTANFNRDASNAMQSPALSLGRTISTNMDMPTPQAHAVYHASHGQSSPASVQHSDSAVASLLYLSQGGRPYTSQADSATGIPIPRVTIDGPGVHYLDDGALPPPTPDAMAVDDGVFLPGSAYHELHSTLRSRLIQEVMSTAPSRQDTPAGDLGDNESDALDLSKSFQASDSLSPGQNQSPLMSKEVECKLWRNWFDEIAPWLDKFDNKRHFQHIIPTMAPTNEHLRYSILALSARQIELMYNKPTDQSLALYQEAIHSLLPHLPSRSTEVIASCVILCVLEMLSCSPKAWQRHLDGCASLMEAVGIDGCSGGVEQALFWTFARMAVCGGLISSVKTLIPVSRWVTKGNLDEAVKLFQNQPDFCSWANYSVYLTAQVINLLMPKSSQHGEPSLTLADDKDKGHTRWLKLWEYICGWHDGRPEPLHPIMTIPSSDPSPFPTIIFSNPAAISGNQLYHTASILMLQNQPHGLRLQPKPRSVLWHARRVCAISISNDHHGAWTNSVQPLWIAGRCMSNPMEHKAILTLLEKIERESGWGTRWRAEDLKAYWGDLGE
ncbi:Zn(2)-C6 fungal-type DNA-binding domain protein [Akanthomyces lecanii RCEF 1005]|uniref:Zn(2)-C6 fungal-type DNA-binding domain protein n=1 Tax=Akanthomyces lecanii RCEF 1005 TaxID=1081108 RepID=A0A168DQQ3_CORDF|nr:Zn(2)-C6 fungal-type DNA-binding domain protein [Akanthomyces lecanii RCEF 1005]